MPDLLELGNVSKSFGSLRIINNLDLTLREGEALGVIGPNGAGKTTMFNLITGTLPSDAGNIIFMGRNVTRLSPSYRCHLGIGRTYQIPQPFLDMTVFENCMVAGIFGTRKHANAVQDVCIRILRQTGLLEKANLPARSLALLDRKRLELARALATDPVLLLLDEIAGGLTESECNQLIELISKLHQAGMTIVWIEHIVRALVTVVDRLMVLNFGQLITEGEPQAVLADHRVQGIYVGAEANAEDR